MDAPTLTAVIAAIAAITGFILTYRASTQANRISSTKVESEAYERGQAIMEKTLVMTERQVEQLRQQVDRLEAQVEREREISTALRRQVQTLKETVALLERHIALMRARLRQAGITWPDASQSPTEQTG